MSYIKILSCKHYNQHDASTVFSNGFVVGNVSDKIETKILAELKTKSVSIDFSFNTILNSTSLYSGVVGDYRIQDTLFNSEISGEQTSFSGAINSNQGIVNQLQKNNPLSGFSNYADAVINFKYETPTVAGTATWLIGTPYLEGAYSKIGSDLYVALFDSTGENPATTGNRFWVKVEENTFIYEITHNWTVRPYLPESDTSGANTVQPTEFAGTNAIKYIFRTIFKDAEFLTVPDKSSERLVNQQYASDINFVEDTYVIYGSLIYRSIDDVNTGNTPSTSPLFWELDPSLDLNDLMQESDTGFYDEKYNGLAVKYTLVSLTTPTNNEVDNDDILYSFQIKNNEGDFTTDAKLTIHSLLERNGSDFDSSLSTNDNTGYSELEIPFDGTTNQNIAQIILEAKAEIDGGDATLANITFTISAGSYNSRFGVFVTPVQNLIIEVPPDCGTSQNSGGAGLTTNTYEGYADGAYSVDYDMLNQKDSMIIYIFDIGSPTDRIILATTNGFVSGTGNLPFAFVAANAVDGKFYIEIEGQAAGTVWYYILNCPFGEGTAIVSTSFSEHNNIWISAYDILTEALNDLQLIGDCPNINFYYHYDDTNERKGISQFKGFVKDPALAKFELENTNPARTVVNQIQLAIKTVGGNVLESTTIQSNALDFTSTKDVTFTNNEKGQIELTLDAGIYNGRYGFVVKTGWLQYSDVVFAVIVNATIVKANSSVQQIIEFKSDVFDLGGLDQTKNTSLEPIMERHDGSIQFWDVTKTTQFAAPLDIGITKVIGVFKEINLGDLQTPLADLTAFLYVNQSGGITDNQYIHDRDTNFLQVDSPFIPVVPMIAIDGGDPTIVTVEADYDAAKASELGFDCVNFGVRIDRVDENPPPNVIEIKDTVPPDTDSKEGYPLDYATYIISRITGGLGAVEMDIIVNGILPNPITPATDIKLEYLHTNGTWFLINTGKVTIPSGETEVNIRLQAIPDIIIEGVEDFEIVISNPTNNTTIQALSDTVIGTISEDIIETILFSLHFSGELTGNNQVAKLFTKADNLQVHNILGMATTFEMKYKDTHGFVDWSLEPVRNLVQIQSDIDGGSDTYSLYFEITSYAVTYLNAVLCLEYDSVDVTNTFQYQSANPLAQNVWIGIPSPYELTIDSITSGNASASLFEFGLKALSSDDMTIYDETLASLNILLSGDTSEKLITLYINYRGVNVNDTIDIDTTII